MMIDVTVAADFQGDLTVCYTHMNPVMAGAALVAQSATRGVFETASHERFIVTGTGLAWSGGALVAGDVWSLTYRAQGADVVTFANLQTTGAALWAAMTAEHDGLDPAALTHLLVHHCWTYHGSNRAEYFPETSLPGFGLLDLTGKDMIYLRGGDDVFFTGSATDTILGGAGDDALYGGSGNDNLQGGSGDDTLVGGSEGDTLSGGFGADSVTGGFGDDVLTGGKGADLFVFQGGAGDDVITDFTPGQDHLRIRAASAVTWDEVDGDVVVHFGAASITLQHVHADQITAGDFI